MDQMKFSYTTRSEIGQNLSYYFAENPMKEEIF